PKDRRRAERVARNDSYQRQRAALRSGDERNFPARDQGAAKSFVRDYVDGRPRVAEFLMPAVVLTWLSLVLHNSAVYVRVQLVMELVVGLGLILGILLSQRVKRKVREQFGDDEVRGTGFYAFSRAVMPRMFRQPKPKVTITGKPKQLG